MKESIMNHPLTVYFPLAGRFFLLHWWTYNDRGHLIIAKTLPALNRTAIRAFQKAGREEVEIKSLSLVEMVAPPLKMVQEATDYKHQEDIKDFLREICFQLSLAAEDGEELPPSFVKCDGFLSEDGDDNPDSDDLKQHYTCANCFARVRLRPDIDKKEFYQRHHQTWYAENPTAALRRAGYLDRNATYSRAEPGRADENLWMAVPVFGHHSSGAVLTPLEDRWGPVLFYYRKLEDMDISELEIVRDKFQAEAQAQYDLEQKLRHQKIDLERKQERDKVLQFFRNIK